MSAGYIPHMSDKPDGFFEGTEMPTAGWWEALWPDLLECWRPSASDPA